MTNQSEPDKMLAGELYLASDPELTRLRRNARRLTRLFNASAEDEPDLRRSLLNDLCGRIGPVFEIEPPFRCDYGFNIQAGDRLHINFDCVILDVCRVEIGDGVMFAPGVHIYAATHPLDAARRCAGPEPGAPVKIGHRVWLGGRSIICPGVTIGDDTVIGAGSVVTRNIPPGVVAAGNPCRMIRKL